MINDFFDGVYWINSIKHPERRKNMESFFEKYGINNHRVEAVYGDNLRFLLPDEERVNNARYYAGCLASHLQAMFMSKVRGDKRILILEDDVVPIDDFESYFRRFESPQFHEQVDWDMMFLGFIPLHDDDSMWDYSIVARNQLQQYPNFVNVTRQTVGAYAYAVTSCMRDFLLEEMSTQDERYYGVEAWMRNLSRFNGRDIYSEKRIYSFIPQLFAHDSGYSTLQPEERLDDMSRSICPWFGQSYSHIRQAD